MILIKPPQTNNASYADFYLMYLMQNYVETAAVSTGKRRVGSLSKFLKNLVASFSVFISLQSDVFSLKRHYGTIGFGVSFLCEPIIHTSIRKPIPEEILCPTAKSIGLQSILLSVSHCFRPLGTLEASGMSQHQRERIHLDDPYQVRHVSYR